MSRQRQLRIAEILRLRARASRVSALSTAWSALGVAVCVLDDDEQRLWLSRLRSQSCTRRAVAGSLGAVIRRLSQRRSIVLVFASGSRPESEPGLLIGSMALLRSEDQLRTMYPDGFVAWDEQQSCGLEIDFTERGFEAWETIAVLRS